MSWRLLGGVKQAAGHSALVRERETRVSRPVRRAARAVTRVVPFIMMENLSMGRTQVRLIDGQLRLLKRLATDPDRSSPIDFSQNSVECGSIFSKRTFLVLT